ncbi:AMP-binding enzyme [Colletotrichum graminicola]|uniref:AMP-binding enzyme n=1 Tax=Colletotrichum graminicola (strain M1.001 / M2 / FGSC 10212) TaxID=645133 RepID=E3QY05_COLGM|nr:AMP-binding enzyme [Colletotrichum graminicola M1.001]EFQ35743.1 AMP-binding enzyme [Colletotrichum graminicola M1.001]WDK10312.1 AMP-binding enzyme [Colletotrichum graminicola]
MMASLCRTPLFKVLSEADASSVAIVNQSTGTVFSYRSLIRDVARARHALLESVGDKSLTGQRIGFIVENGYGFVVTFLSILASSAVAVPLAPSHPLSELRYILNDSAATVVISSAAHAKQAQQVVAEGLDNVPVLHQISEFDAQNEDDIDVEWTDAPGGATSGMMLYTSGTTARPKGVLLREACLLAQAQSLHKAWDYRPSDRLLHILPLHHIHGTMNALLAPLLAGSSVEFMIGFNAERVWSRLAAPFLPVNGNGIINGTSNGTGDKAVFQPITFLTAVPTVWARMLSAYPSLSTEIQRAGREAISVRHLRLNISGSAALPAPTRDAWTKLSGGNTLLERYGMTEIGMAISCGLDYSDRVESSVGWPLPSVEVRLAEKNDDTGEETIIGLGEEKDPATGKERQGEIQIRGSTIFSEYWRNPAATEKEFTGDGWFRTGDIAVRRAVPGAGEGKSGSWARGPAYFIQGRRSADIIKSGGEKISALEIERELLGLPNVAECAVVGLPSEAWGQKVAAVVVLSDAGKNSAEPWGLKEMRRDLKVHIPPFKVPQDLEIVDSIKRNAMGKVNKKDLVAAVFGDTERIRRRSISGRQ